MVTLHDERLLFTKDDWSIYKAYYVKDGPSGQILAFAYHHSCPETAIARLGAQQPVNCWHPGDTYQRCILCTTDVPQEIQTLIVLYQWKR